MAQVGMDTDLANSQAQQFSSQGVDALSTLITTLDSLVGQIESNWKGNDASNFNNEWTSNHRTALSQIHTALADFHTKFVQNINEQISTSSS